jgi:hypothetical protein
MMKYTAEELKGICLKHIKWLRSEEGGERANLEGASLQRANLRHASLQHADLRGANLDYSCLPLWCGGSQFKADSRLVRQILAHVVTLEIEDADDGLKIAIESIKIEARKSHRASDLGLGELDSGGDL